MIPDHDHDGIIRNGYGYPVKLDPFVIDWTQFGEALDFLASRLKAKQLVYREPFKGVVRNWGDGSMVLHHLLVDRLGLPSLAAPPDRGFAIYPSLIARPEGDFKNIVEAAIVSTRKPSPPGLQWYYAVAPGREVAWPWEASSASR